ncbi:MAG TPA: glycosyltransferase family 4 protein [Gemmatimonadales bacterium]|nr:glycosyltransferase family 4 protein [Gemmatimonadales bacterium]
MRAVILSHLYLDPDRRGKLRALAGQGAALVAAVPGGVTGEDGGVWIAPIPARGDLEEPESLQWSRTALRRLFADVHPDVVQIEEEPDSQAAAAAAAEAARLGIPVVLFSWETNVKRRGFRERRRAQISFGAAHAAIGGNALAAEQLRLELPQVPIVSMPQLGVAPPAPVEHVPGEALSIGYIGRLLPERAVDMLLRACSLVMGSWVLTVAGTGPEQEELELLAQRLGLASRIRWLGGVGRAEIETLWPSLDCLVLPARRSDEGVERWSTVLVDAMARGVVPVVMEGGILHAVVGAAGKTAKDEESLGVALQTLKAYPEERRRLSAAARQRVLENYVDAALAEQTLSLWRVVVARKGQADS